MGSASENQKLSPDQKKAVEHKTGPLLIVAGAGTGKTTIIAERVKWLIGTGLAKPEEILALTFTEKAAREMEERIDIALPYGTFGLFVSTFHSFCDKLLRLEALHVGLSPNFKLMTDAETYLFVKKNFWKFDLSYFRPHGNPYKFIEGLTTHFARLKDEDVTPDDYLLIANDQLAKAKKSSPEDLENQQKFLELAKAYKLYEDLKTTEAVMDFSDLISNLLKLFRTRKSVLARYQSQFKYILVDEFQDTNYAQYQLVKLLAPPDKSPNLTIVGDDSQSIYKFRGAAISNILSFMKDYPDAEKVVLTVNYRSSRPILDSAYKLIKQNDPYTLEAQLGISKNLTPGRKLPEKDIELLYVDRVEEEAEKVVEKITEIKKKQKLAFKDFAILLRANNHSEPFVKALERSKVPYQFLGPGMLFRQPEIKDLIAYLKVLYDFTDSLSLYRVLSMPIFDLSQRDITLALATSRRANLSLFETLEKADLPGLSPDSRKRLEDFVAMVHRHQELIPKETAGSLLYRFLEETGLLKKVVSFSTVFDEKRATNMMKFFDRLKSFEATHEDSSVFAVVDYLDLAMSMGESPLAAEIDWSENDAVNLLTIHSAKGLEFPIVFLVNLVEGRFPSNSRREPIPIPDSVIKELLPEGDYHLQEERRLFYVGMTRAKQELIFTAANYYGEGKRVRKLSPFVSESLGVDSFEKTPSATSSQLPLFEWSRPTVAVDGNAEFKTLVDFLSYSAIDTFKICPLHYKIRNILHVPVPMTAAQSIGNSVHLVLRAFLDQQRTGALTGKKKADLIKALDDLLLANWIKEGFTSSRHHDESFEKARSFLTTYLESDLHKDAHPLYLEEQFKFFISSKNGSNPKPLKLIGKIDRVDDRGGGKIEIIDYKTGANPPTPSEIANDLQMTIYALAAANPGILKKDVSDVTLSFYYFDSGKKISTSRTPESLERATSEVLAIRDEIERSDFHCTNPIFCANCEYKILCND